MNLADLPFGWQSWSPNEAPKKIDMAGENQSESPSSSPRPVEEIDRSVIRFAGDSGDGMQLTGNEFTRAVAMGGADLVEVVL